MRKLLFSMIVLIIFVFSTSVALAAVITCTFPQSGDECRGTNNADQITGSLESDNIFGLDGADTIFANRGRDDVRGGQGQDDIDDHDNAIDYIFGGSGNDNINVVDDPEGGTVLNPYGDTVECGDGNDDKVRFDKGVDRIHGDCEDKVPV